MACRGRGSGKLTSGNNLVKPRHEVPGRGNSTADARFPQDFPRLGEAMHRLSFHPGSMGQFPDVDFKVWLDLQFQMLAADPAFAGIYGVTAYQSTTADPEIIAWLSRLFRHYCIEGKRSWSRQLTTGTAWSSRIFRTRGLPPAPTVGQSRPPSRAAFTVLARPPNCPSKGISPKATGCWLCGRGTSRTAWPGDPRAEAGPPLLAAALLLRPYRPATRATPNPYGSKE